ncbi:hypothetical protein HHI36_023496 [Cryptolaemus montrouzieri]|uniref:Peptidase S1 domain-containing protein n=1 Tax=Cryptolaemus montrouzieri TaxID=559131 RepID=A0ABD2PGL5_9CUCU
MQGTYNRRPISPWQEAPRSRDRLCPLALAVASFLVLIVVLVVAGSALYMGALHSEFPSPLVTFSCSIKVLRGDRFVGSLHEKARLYTLQFETLYKRSILGPALVECSVDKFGEDTYTIHFTLTFDRKRLPRSNTPIEKVIGDVITSDLLSKKPIFRNVRFVPGSMRIQDVNLKPTTSTKLSSLNATRKKSGIVLKHPASPISKNTSLTIGSNSKKKIPAEGKKPSSAQGSFKISKTEADITEKLDTTTGKSKIRITTSKHTTVHPVKNVRKNDESDKLQTEISKPSSSTLSTIIKLPIPTIPTQTEVTTPLFIFNSDFFDKEPWTPLVFNKSLIPKPETKSFLDTYEETKTDTNNNEEGKKPVYTSFTNPSLTIFQKKIDPLGVTNLKGHPIPVNKIVDMTEPNIVSINHFEEVFPNLPLLTSETSNQKENIKLIEVDTVNYKPSTIKPERDDRLKNISTIFHDLVSSIGKNDVKESEKLLANQNSHNFDHALDGVEDINFGQGQVEVVDADEELIMKATTKLPLVTLIPVKSNSGVGKPLRRRPFRKNQTDDDQEERSLKDLIPLANPKIPPDTNGKTANNPIRNFKIVGMLTFEPEKTEDESATEYVRKAKMEASTDGLVADDLLDSEMMIHVFNSSKLESRQPNMLTPEKIKLLSEISKIYNENQTYSEQTAFSTKAVRPTYSMNNFGFKILSKYLNKAFMDVKKEVVSEIPISESCTKDDIICGDGKCLSKSTRCNHLKDCSDGRDEQNCTCADYLRTQYLTKKICDGVIDCWDFSDENNCDWCHPGQHICANSKECVDKEKICDGIKHCLEGDDERQCFNIGKDLGEAEKFLYHTKGFLMIRKFGEWGKLCVDNLRNTTNESLSSWRIDDLGREFCQSLTYRNFSSVQSVVEEANPGHQKFYELADVERRNNQTSWAFVETTCEKKTVVQVSCHSLECGFRPQIVRYRARIVGGRNAGMGSWPWQAALYKEGEFQCGGSLLSDKWIMSAGHCFYKSQQEYWVARLGALRRSTALPSPYEELIPIHKIFIHPGYKNDGFVNDIALLRLKSAVTFSDYVRPVCLPSAKESLEDDVQCTILGWGQLSEVGRIFPDTLQEVQIPVISTAECRKRTVFLPLYNITEEMFCAGFDRGGRDACLGDSGGPLICPEENGRWVIHGITSNGYGCARANRPGVYTKVSSYVTWIQDYFEMKDTNPVLTAIEGKGNVCSGHRCPLGQCLPKSQVCNGYTECNDGSDEVDC